MNNYPKQYFYKKIVAAKLFIDNNYSKNIDVSEIAGEACFTKYDFIRQFKKVYKKTPYTYLRSVRLKKAMKLLRSSDMTVKDICFEVGYESPSSFSLLFKKKFGISPYQYQAKAREEQLSIQKQPLGHIPGCFAEKNGWK